MRIELNIPKNLDLTQLITECLPEYNGNKGGINEVNLAFICHSIISQWLNHKTDYWERKFERNYVPLCASILRKYVPQYENCTHFLIKTGVILCDNKYEPGEKCYGYTFTKQYIGRAFKKFTAYGVLKGKIISFWEQRVIENNNLLQKLIKRRKHLIQCITSQKLTIEKEAVLEVRRMYKDDVRSINKYYNQDTTNSQQLLNEACINRNVNYELIKLLNSKKNKDGLPFYIIDKTGLRLHSPITRLPEKLRKFIRYEGKQITAIDINNSQPYFSLLLLKGKSGGIKQLHKIGIKIKDKISNKYIPIIEQILAEMPANAAFLIFKNDVLSGNLYNRFVQTPETSPDFKADRNEIKKDFLMSMYDVARYYGKAKKFVDTYPEVFEVFNSIKSIKTGVFKRRTRHNSKQRRITLKAVRNMSNKGVPGRGFNKNLKVYPDKEKLPEKLAKNTAYDNIDSGYTLLAILLQRIESHLLLDTVCYKIAKDYPHIPLITIHDSIGTTNEYIDIVEQTTKDILKKVIGEEPKLKKEYWGEQPQNV